VEELHDAPVLYLSAETVPRWGDAEKRKLRAYTDSGGTILFHASRENEPVQRWFADLAGEVWPEWPLRPLAAEHPVFTAPFDLKRRPEVQGIDDGLRTFVFNVDDDISCAWQNRSFAAKEYLFRWAANLVRYATDGGPLRWSRLAYGKSEPDRYPLPVKAGAKTSIRIARLKYEGVGWIAGRNYRGFDAISQAARKRAGVTLKVDENGAAAGDLGDADAAYVAATPGMTLGEADRAALKRYVAGGGFLWIEAVGGKPEAEAAARTLAADAGWTIAPLSKDHGLLCGKFEKAAGYNLTSGVEFRHTLRMQRLGRNFAELSGIFQGGKLIGVYSPFDVVFSSTEYQAYNCRGYRSEDALALATNIILLLTDRPAPK
jgi:hypothetical protein